MRLIVRIDTKDGWVVKGRQLEGVQKQYNLDQLFNIISEDTIVSGSGITEFIVHDSVASLYKWPNYFIENEVIPYSGRPLTISGGINCISDALKLAKRSERLCVNTHCHTNLDFVREISKIIGAQSISMELQILNYNGAFSLLLCNGKEVARKTLNEYLDMIADVEFGEINVLSVNNDGMKRGLDIRLYEIVRNKFPRKSISLGGGLASLNNISNYEQYDINGVVFSTLFHEMVKKKIGITT